MNKALHIQIYRTNKRTSTATSTAKQLKPIVAIIELAKEPPADTTGILFVGIYIAGHPAITTKGAGIPGPYPFSLPLRILYILCVETKTGRTDKFTTAAIGASFTQFLP
mgnify:CR=1 FL=1